MTVSTHMLGVCVAEAEFSILLEACAGGGTYQQIAYVLKCMGDELTGLKETTIRHAQRCFESDRALAAFAAGGELCGKGVRWEVSHQTVDPTGFCAAAGRGACQFCHVVMFFCVSSP